MKTENPLLDKKQAAALLQVSYRQFRDRLSKQPGFPPPTLYVTRTVQLWKVEDLIQWARK